MSKISINDKAYDEGHHLELNSEQKAAIFAGINQSLSELGEFATFIEAITAERIFLGSAIDNTRFKIVICLPSSYLVKLGGTDFKIKTEVLVQCKKLDGLSDKIATAITKTVSRLVEDFCSDLKRTTDILQRKSASFRPTIS